MSESSNQAGKAIQGCLASLMLVSCCFCCGWSAWKLSGTKEALEAPIPAGEKNGAKYFAELKPGDGITHCDLVFSSDPKDPAFVDRTLRSAVQAAAAKDGSKDILGVAFIGDDAMDVTQHSGMLIYRAAQKQIMFLDRDPPWKK